jgi:hypothetical protein
MTDKKLTNVVTEALEHEVPRRSFLKYIGAVLSVAALPEALSACATDAAPMTVSIDEESLTTTWPPIQIVRPEDMLVLTFGLVGLTIDTTANRILRIVPSPAPSPLPPAYLIVDFPPQAIAEDAYQASDPLKAVSGSMLSGPTRLVFRVPADWQGDDYSLDTLLKLCTTGDMIVASSLAGASITAPIAATALTKPGGSPMIAAKIDQSIAGVDAAAAARLLAASTAGLPSSMTPPSSSTVSGVPVALGDKSISYIELPYRLQLSPHAKTAWSHETTAVPSPTTGRFELWHTEMGVRGPVAGSVDLKNSLVRTVRAIHTRDDDLTPPPQADTDPGANYVLNPSLAPSHRRALIQISGAPKDASSPAPPPIGVDRLMLSALGGYLDVKADFDNSPNSLQRWIHRMTGGREHFVEVVSTGYLLPFGNKATHVKLTQRSDAPGVGDGALRFI